MLPSSSLTPPPVTCRSGCGACCIAPSISTPIPGMPDGKPAGERCIQLDDDNACKLFDDPRRPAVCSAFPAAEDVCGANRDEAMALIARWEQLT